MPGEYGEYTPFDVNESINFRRVSSTLLGYLKRGISKRLAGHYSRHFRSVKNDTAVHYYRGEAFRILMRLWIGRFIADSCFVKDHEICAKALTDLTSIAEIERLRWK